MEPRQINIQINQTTAVVCECGAETFNQVAMLRKVSALLSPTGKEVMMPIAVFECTYCGKILPESLPAELNSDSPDEKE